MVEMFQPEVNASSYQIRRRYFRLQKFIRLRIEMRYLVIFISMASSRLNIACVAGGIRGHKGGSLKYRLPKN